MEKQSELVRLAFVGVLVWAALKYLRGSTVAYNVGDISSKFEVNPLTGRGFEDYNSPLRALAPPAAGYYTTGSTAPTLSQRLAGLVTGIQTPIDGVAEIVRGIGGTSGTGTSGGGTGTQPQ